MADTDPPGLSVNVDVRIQPGPDGTPWEALNITHGIMGATIVVPPGALTEMCQRIPALLDRAMELAIDADNTAIRERLSVIPADAMDKLPSFEASRTLNRNARRHPPRA